MRIYCIIVAAAITLIFATAATTASATPRPDHGFKNVGHAERGERQERHGHKNGHSKREERAVNQRQQHAGADRHDRRDHYRSPRHDDKRRHLAKKHKRHVEHHQYYTPKKQHPVKHYHKKHGHTHRSYNDINWLINVDLGPYYSEPSYNPVHRIYYRRYAGGSRCYRVEERADRTVWIDVPYYKCY